MTTRADLSVIKKASLSLRTGMDLKRSLNDLVAILRNAIHGDVGGIVVRNGGSTAVISEGFSTEEKRRLVKLAGADNGKFIADLKTWLGANIISKKLETAENRGILFIGRHNNRRFSPTDEYFFEVLSRFAEVTLMNHETWKAVEDRMLAEERDRFACELHDGLAQSIYGMALQIKICRKLINQDTTAADAKLKRLEGLAAVQIEDIRGYMRTLKENRGISLDFKTVIQKLVRQLCSVHGLSCEVKTSGKQVELSQEIRENLYYVVSEALSNAVRHAHASKVRISLAYGKEELEVKVDDNGRGFDVSSLKLQTGKETGMGLENIRHRVSRIGGVVKIQSNKNAGTKIIAVVPYVPV